MWRPTLLLTAAGLALVPQFASTADEPRFEPLDVASALETAVAEAIEQARPSVVTIDRIKAPEGRTLAVRGRRGDGFPRNGFEVAPGVIALDGNRDEPSSEDFVSHDFGSGVVIDENGAILTNYHVVVGAARLIVRAPDLPPFDAVIRAADPRGDLAVIEPLEPRLDDNGEPALKPIPLGDASALRPGSFLVALGNAHNTSRDGRASASFGILANTGRRLIAPPPEQFGQLPTRQLQHYSTLFQLDSKLNLGMSGGAVVNLRGELVAITTATADAVGYDPRAGYAIPFDRLGSRIVEELVQGKEVEYGFLGIRLNSPSNVVSSVQPGTPAGEGGLIDSDAIIAVDDMSVSDFDELIRAVNASPVGEPVQITIRRNGRLLDKTVTMSKFPVEGEVIATNRPPAWRGARIDYSSVISKVDPSIDLLEAMARGGVGILEVEPDSPAEQAGLRPGMIIAAVNDEPVKNPKAFRNAVADLNDQPVTLLLGGRFRRIEVPPEN